MRIEAVIFDWGGVMIDDPAPLLLAEFCRELRCSAEAFVAAMKNHGEPFQKGLCSEGAFWKAMCGELGAPAPSEPSLWGRVFRATYSRKPAMWSLVRSLRNKRYKTALLSNTELPASDLLRDGNDTPFDELILSCCEGCYKPERRIYELALQRLGTAASASVFIDDRADFIQGAQAVGMHGILFRSPEAVVEELVRLGVRAE